MDDYLVRIDEPEYDEQQERLEIEQDSSPSQNLHARLSANCIFRVHEGLHRGNKEAYTPMLVSIGPYHHGTPKLLAMEKHKSRYVDSLLKRTNRSRDQCLRDMAELEQGARNSYADPIDVESEDFVKMMLHDACFVIEFLRKLDQPDLRQDDPIFTSSWMTYQICRDLILLENQIPFFVLTKLFGIDFQQLRMLTKIPIIAMLPEADYFLNVKYIRGSYEIIHLHFLDLVHIGCIPRTESESDHECCMTFLDLVRHKFCLPRSTRTPVTKKSGSESASAGKTGIEAAPGEESVSREPLVGAAPGFLAAQGAALSWEPSVGAALSREPSVGDSPVFLTAGAGFSREPLVGAAPGFLTAKGAALSWEPLVGAAPGFLTAKGAALSGAALSREPLVGAAPHTRPYIKMPCVIDLQEAGINISVRKDLNKEGKDQVVGMLDITFKCGCLKIPKFLVSDFTEIFLRNIIAYEQHSSIAKPKFFTDYAYFMDLLINSKEDVNILRRSKILENMLGSDEAVADLFNRVCEGTIISQDYHYSELCKKVNEHYDNCWNQCMANLRHDYFNSPWASIATIAAVLLLLLTITQTVAALIPLFT